MATAKVGIKSGDQVLIIAGKDKGRKGKILKVLPGARRVVVEGINIAKRHRRPTAQRMQGGIQEEPAPIHASNVMIVCRSCHEATRIGHKTLEDGRRVRACRRCGEIIDR